MMLVEVDTAFEVEVFLESSGVDGDPALGLADGDFTVKQYRVPGGAWTTISGTITEVDFGLYVVPISGTENDTYGCIWIRLVAFGMVTFVGKVAQAVGYSPESAIATASEIAALQSDTNDIQTRLPAALVSGRMDSSVGAMATGTLTASALASDAVTEIQLGLPTAAAVAAIQSDTDNIQTRLPAALSGGRMDSITNAMAAGVVTAAVIATDAIDADAVAADAVTKIQNGLVTSSALDDVAAKIDSLEAVALGRWEVTGNQLILYEMDGTTPLATFDLLDATGTPSSTSIFERVPA